MRMANHTYKLISTLLDFRKKIVPGFPVHWQTHEVDHDASDDDQEIDDSSTTTGLWSPSKRMTAGPMRYENEIH